MKRELRILCTALMFYTRIPGPKWVGHEPEYINLSVRYFPFIGWIVGGASFAAFYLGSWLVNDLTGIFFSLAASVLVTGAFHEDGFADVCDGFGGGWTKERILMIMKDSRVGAFGVIGILLLFGLKANFLFGLVSAFDDIGLLLIFVASHALSRFTASTFIFTHVYVRDTPDSKSKPVAQQASLLNLWIGAFFGLTPFLGAVFWLASPLYLLLLLVIFLANYFLGRYFTKWIGGYTGDCLGAAQQVAEVVFLFSILMVWKFI